MYSTTATSTAFPHATSNPNQGKPLLAISGALIWPGLGHFLIGSYYLGAFWFTAATGLVLGIASVLVTPAQLPLLGILVPAILCVGIIQVLDSVRCARKNHAAIFHDATLRFTAAAVMMVIAILWQHRVIAYLQNHLFEVCYTPTPSEAPVLAEGDFFVTLKNVPIKRWDIAGFDAPENLVHVRNQQWMKRVVGLPGETVEITPQGVLVNGQILPMPDEAGPYLCTDRWRQQLAKPSKRDAANGCWGRPITLQADEYFLLGDNTLHSTDARFWPTIRGHQPGAMPIDQINCKVLAICWPPSRWRMFN